MTMYPSAHIKKQVAKLAKLYENGQVSETTARNLNKVLDFEVNQVQTDLVATEKDLGELEHRYNMSTKDFFSQWQAGQTDDRMDYFEWAALAQMADRIQKRLNLLTGENRGDL